jgi:pimeloyl-ACP methyl ester carboxylesterase
MRKVAAGLHYDDLGDGDPIVLLHGGLVTIELTFGGAVEAMARHRRVLAVHLQGHGPTPDSDRVFTIPNLGDDVVAFLDQLGIDRADVWGFSLGGLVAFDVAVRHPGRVRRLVVASIDYQGRVGEGDIPPDRLPTAEDFAAMRAAAPDPAVFDAVAARVPVMVKKFTGWTDDQVRAVTAPTLVLCGDRDFVPVRYALDFHELLPRSQLGVLPGTTHMGMTRSADRLVPIVEYFLQDAG